MEKMAIIFDRVLEVLKPCWTVLKIILWMVLGGAVACAIFYIVGGILYCTFVGRKLAMELFRLGKVMFDPSKYDVSANYNANSRANLIWVIILGWPLWIIFLAFAIITGATFVGIPFSQRWLRCISISLFPFGVDIHEA